MSNGPSAARGVLTVLIVSIALVGCGDQGVEPSEVGNPDRGREIFESGGSQMTSGCTDCHSLTEEPVESILGDPVAPSLLGIGEQAGDRVADMSAVEYLHESIDEPEAYRVEGFDDFAMNPALGELLTAEEKDDLIAFLLTQ